MLVPAEGPHATPANATVPIHIRNAMTNDSLGRRPRIDRPINGSDRKARATC
ncbi:MAG: hypothetical protein IAG13_13560 [Deltaproteobacteria bacterium]|nr:hypothetical protein [Nannocystaceae bacterium]